MCAAIHAGIDSRRIPFTAVVALIRVDITADTRCPRGFRRIAISRFSGRTDAQARLGLREHTAAVQSQCGEIHLAACHPSSPSPRLYDNDAP